MVFTGSREWTKEEPVRRVLDEQLDPEKHVIVHGAAKGLDAMVDRLARARGFAVVRFPIPYEEWQRYGKAAGPIRNAAMLTDMNPSVVYAFVKLDARTGEWTRGTADCVETARQLGIRVVPVTD